VHGLHQNCTADVANCVMQDLDTEVFRPAFRHFQYYYYYYYYYY